MSVYPHNAPIYLVKYAIFVISQRNWTHVFVKCAKMHHKHELICDSCVLHSPVSSNVLMVAMDVTKGIAASWVQIGLPEMRRNVRQGMYFTEVH